MDELHYEVSRQLLEKVKSGEATHQEISNAIKFLHNNGITAEVKQGDPLDLLQESLPYDQLPSQHDYTM